MDSSNPSKNVNNFLSYEILDVYGNDISGSYDVNVEYGYLSVDKKVVAIAYNNISSVYTGKAYEINELEVTVNSVDQGVSLYYDGVLNPDPLPLNWHLFAHLDEEEGKNFIYTNNEGYQIQDSFWFSIERDNGVGYDVILENSKISPSSNNFSFQTFNSSVIYITKRNMTIKNMDAVYLYYDGLVATEQKAVSGLASGDSLYFAKSAAEYEEILSVVNIPSDEFEHLEKYAASKTDYTCHSPMSEPGTYQVSSKDYEEEKEVDNNAEKINYIDNFYYACII